MPESMDDPVFGRLDWDESLDWWVGSVELFPGHGVEVFVTHDPDDGSPAEALAAARRLFRRVREREPEYRRWSAEQLHATRWNAHEPMTVEEVVALLRVASLEFAPDGTTRIFWNDGDVLFAGHNVVTEVAADGTCTAAGME